MNRIFAAYAALTFLALTFSVFAQNLPTTASLQPEVTICVHDYADVPRPLLAAAELYASGIFHRAGLQTVWLNCGPKLEDTQTRACFMADTTHLTFKILPHARSAQFRDRNEVLGTALLDENGTGYFAYAFYDRVRRVADDRRLGSALLGAVLAHEIGHLLLGSNSHSVTGIMSGQWEYRELMNISESVMTFVPAQSKTIQDRLRLAQPERTRENNDNAGNADSLAAFGGK